MTAFTDEEQERLDRLVEAARSPEQAFVIVAAAFPNLDKAQIEAAITESEKRKEAANDD